MQKHNQKELYSPENVLHNGKENNPFAYLVFRCLCERSTCVKNATRGTVLGRPLAYATQAKVFFM